MLVNHYIRHTSPLVGLVYAATGPSPTTLLCDGSLINIDKYPELFDAIGHAYSRREPVPMSVMKKLWMWFINDPVPLRVVEPAGMFRLPDMRGRAMELR